MRQYSYSTSLVINITLQVLICGTYFMKSGSTDPVSYTHLDVYKRQE